MENDIDVDTEILKYLDKNGIVWREKLRIDTAKIVDRSEVTIDKHLRSLRKLGEIDFIKGNDAIQMGVKIKGLNASYIFSKNYLDTKKHIDKVFHTFENEIDDKLKEIELIEINSHKGYSFTPKQLDSLIDNLDSNNNKLSKTTMNIIFKHYRKGFLPINTKKFISKIKSTLENYKDDTRDGKNMRICSILLLGHYEDDAVIDQIIDDLNENRTSEDYKYSYIHEQTAKVIDKNKDRLFEFQKELIKKGEEEKEVFIRQIRYKARSFIYPDEYQDETYEYVDDQGNKRTGRVI